MSDYELLPEGLKRFWSVTTSFYDSGKVVSKLTDTIEAATKPENSCVSLKNRDLYIDWFDTKEAAEQHSEEARKSSE